MRILTRYLFLFLGLLSAWFVYFCVFTTSGLQLSVALLAHYLPGKLTLKDIEGNLASHIVLHAVSYQDKDTKIFIESASVHWQPRQLLNGRIDILRLSIGKTSVEILENTEESFNIDTLTWLRLINIHNVNLQQVEISINENKIRFNGSLSDTWDLNWDAQVPNLSMIDPAISGALTSHGTIKGTKLTPSLYAELDMKKIAFEDYKINQLHAKTELSLLHGAKSVILIDASGLNLNDFIIKKISIDTQESFIYDKQTLKTTATIKIQNQPIIHFQATLPNFSHYKIEHQPITGSIDFNIKNIGMFSEYIPVIENAKGNVHGKIQLNGEVLQPKASLDMQLNQGNLSIPELGLTLNNINIQATTSLNKQLHLTGNFQSDNGNAKLQGLWDFGKIDYPLSLNLQGDKLLVYNLPHYKVYASPDLKMNFSNNKTELNGDIRITQADITPTDFSSTITMPDDVIYVGETQKHNLNFLTNLSLNLNIILEDNIYIQYEDLQTHLSGKIKITQDPGNPAFGYGELYTINGKYRAYGQLLKIQQGRLIYTGNPLLNPGLDIRALREIKTIATHSTTSGFSTNTQLQPAYLGNETIKVGVQIHGTAQKPLVALFSEPAMSQGDTLSYLLFGYPQSQAKGTNQIGALLNATSMLNSSGKTPLTDLTDGLQDKLGLSELGVGSTEIFNPTTGTSAATTSFIVGKQLAKDLYIHYSIGLFNPVSILNLRYKLSKRWSIQSETSSIDNGADFLYELERN